VPAVAFAGLVLSLLAAALRVARSSSADTPPPGDGVGDPGPPAARHARRPGASGRHRR